MQKVLFLVPHEDDEIFVGGALLINLIRSGEYEPYVFIATNGDFYPHEKEKRIQESLKALEMIGMEKEHIIFGGYGDCWKEAHIYNSPDEEKKVSYGGFEETYVAHSGYKEWHYLKYGVHQSYTRAGYLNDLKDLISSLRPEIIVCVDLDFHRDHKCLSLLTEEALGYILKEDKRYRPVMLKKYAYQGVLSGKRDYFHVPHYPTVNEGNNTSNPYLLWQDRICYQVPKDCNTFFLRKNFLYKLIRIYKTQDVWMSAPGFINSDIVYWKRNTNNLALDATILVSSGECCWLNDFKLVDTDDVTPRKSDYTRRCWRPNADDSQKTVQVTLPEINIVSRIVLFFNNVGEMKRGHTIVKLFDESNNLLEEREISCLKDGIYAESIQVGKVKDVKVVHIQFENESGSIGLGEIEILGEEDSIPFQEFLSTDVENNGKSSMKYKMENMIQKMDELCFKFQCYIFRYLRQNTK